MASEQDVNTYIKEFPEFYQRELAPILSGFEKERIEKNNAAKNILKFVFVFGAVFVICLLYLFLLKGQKSLVINIITVLSFIGTAIPTAMYISLKKGFEIAVKTAVLEKFLSFFGSDYAWGRETSIDSQDLKSSMLFPDFENISTDDNFTGSFKGHNFALSEMCLTKNIQRQVRQQDGTMTTQSETINLFRGVIVKIAFNKKFTSQTVIVHNKSNFLDNVNFDLTNGLSLEFNANQKLDLKSYFKSKKMEPVELEDVEFNKIFDIYSHDQVESRFLLTTSFMERFKLLTKAFGTQDIRASFVDNSIIIAIPSDKDMFVLGSLDTSMEDSKPVQDFFKELISILSIIDILKIYQKTGL